MSAGSMSSIDGETQTEKNHEDEKISLAKLLFTFAGLYERCFDLFKRFEHALEARRHPPERGPDPDYASGLDNLENVRKIIKEEMRDYEPGIHVNNSKGPDSSWQNKVLVGVAITVISAVILGAFTTWALVGSLKTKIDMYITSTNQRLDSHETRIRDTERRLDRGAGIP